MDRQEWFAGLPARVAALAEWWELELGEPYPPTECAWVAPVLGQDQVLKVGWLHPEALHEVDALRLWDGEGAVLLLSAQVTDDTCALLLERLGPPLSTRREEEQDVVIAGLLQRLWVAGSEPFRPLREMCEQWVAGAQPSPLDPGLVRAGHELFVDLADGEALLLTDLHAGNVLEGMREPWLAIDPKPYVGDRHYDVLQHLLNCRERLADNPQALVRRMAGLLDLDPVRVTQWLFARCVIESGNDPQLAELAERLAP